MSQQSDNEARELLKRLAERWHDAPPLSQLNFAMQQAREYLQRTEPKHPVDVAFDEWWSTDMESRAESDGLTYREVAQPAARTFYRKGMEAAAEIVKGYSAVEVSCSVVRHILNAAKEVPE